MMHQEKNNFRKKLKRYHSPLMVLLITAVLLLFFSFAFKYPTVGGAIRETPDAPLDFVRNGTAAIDVSRVPAWEIDLQPSAGERNIYGITTALRDSAVQYQLSEGRNILARGYLGKGVSSSQGIFVDEDAIADIEFRYNPENKIFIVDNPRFVAPATSVITLKKEGVSVDAVSSVRLNKESVLTIEAKSDTRAPVVSVSFDDAGITPVLQETSAAETSRRYELRWTPTAEKMYHLTITATVGTQQSSQIYVFAGNGVLYQLNDLQYPQMKITLLDDPTQQARVDYIFSSLSQKQPFSLPCVGNIPLETPVGSTGVSQVPSSQLDAVYSYGYQRPLQWKSGVPSELYTLESFKGYLLRVKNQQVSFSVNCRLSTELPALQQGWNFVGITGFASRSSDDLSVKLPPGAHLRQVRELQRDEVSQQVATLEPGKAYWVLVE